MNSLAYQYLDRGVAGLKPGKRFHLGSYFGTLKKVLDFEKNFPGENFLFIADLHSSLDRSEPMVSRSRIQRLVAECLYLGINPEKTCIFVQSQIPEVFQLTLRLASISPLLGADPEHTHLDALYETLMGADVLGLRASVVNVGRDVDRQVNNCTRLANAMNEYLQAPLLPRVVRGRASQGDLVPGLDGEKMSYSSHNYIPIFFDSDNEFDDVLNRITPTSPAPYFHAARVEVAEAEVKPGIRRGLFGAIAELVADCQQLDDTCNEFDTGQIGFPECRRRLKEWISDYFRSAWEMRDNAPVTNDQIDAIVEEGCVRARREYRETLLDLSYVLHDGPRAAREYA